MKSLTALALILASNLLAQEVLSNDSILKLVTSGIGDDLVVNMIQTQPGKYSIGPDDVLRLKRAGVSEKILTAMTRRNGVIEPSGAVVKIQAKTPVSLAVANALSSKSSNAGDKFTLVATEDVNIGGHVVIAKGAPASGRIVAAEKKSFATHNGKLEIEVDSVEAIDGHNVPVNGHMSIGGDGVGFGRTGKEAEIEKGKVVNAVVTESTEVKLGGQ